MIVPETIGKSLEMRLSYRKRSGDLESGEEEEDEETAAGNSRSFLFRASPWQEPLTLDNISKERAKIEQAATKYVFLYPLDEIPPANPTDPLPVDLSLLISNGGFAYFDAESKCVAINVLQSNDGYHPNSGFLNFHQKKALKPEAREALINAHRFRKIHPACGLFPKAKYFAWILPSEVIQNDTYVCVCVFFVRALINFF